jgi:hypothetical protein
MRVDYVRVYRAAPPAVERPAVTACDPPRGERNATLDLRVVGRGFLDGARVTFGGGTKVLSTRVISPGEILVRLKIQKNAKRGTRNVTVRNPGGRSGTGRNLFTIS